MLERLKYSVTFPSTGRTLSADLTFDKGFTAITGENESGKSMIFEVARWLLFGTDALRGSADHYKSLKGEGTFVVRGAQVEITRTARAATMKRNGVVVATGTKPVSAKVVEELGFGLAVFDVACSINQGEVERLGAMLPAQRKAMVDSVLGLAILDNISKWALEEAKALDRQAEALRGRLTPPGAPPSIPDGYQPTEELRVLLAALRVERDELAHLQGVLSVSRPAPVAPAAADEVTAEQAASRKSAREAVARLEAQVAALPRAAVFDTLLLDQVELAWTAWHAHDEAQRWLKANPEPRYNALQLQVYGDDYTALDNIAARARLVTRIEHLATHSGKLGCVQCGHENLLEQDEIARLEAEHDALLVPRDGFVPQTPPVPRGQLATELARVQSFDARKAAAMRAVPAQEKPSLAERELPTYRRQVEQVRERGELAANLADAEEQLAKLPDYESGRLAWLAYERALSAYQVARVEFDAWVLTRDAAQLRALELAGVPARHDAAAAAFTAAQQFETASQRYSELEAAYAREQDVVDGLSREAEDHRKIRDTMNVLRGLIKQHVLPGLNRVASHLLRQMTGGQRNVIAIDENFDVVVDGQGLETLSGSGKACANLAIRIALGQVLTNRVISILLADEIDASMDEFRAEKTANVLGMLDQSVSQLLLISHKPIDATHHIRLGEQQGERDFGREAA